MRRATQIRGIGTVLLFISIHALREEGDLRKRKERGAEGEFLSTPSVRRATWCLLISPFLMEISIHALREEGDGPFCLSSSGTDDFYPRPP